MNPRASSGLKKRCKHRGTQFTSSAQPIKPGLGICHRRVAEVFFDHHNVVEVVAQRRRRSIAEALERKRQAYGGRWEAQALCEGRLKERGVGRMGYSTTEAGDLVAEKK